MFETFSILPIFRPLILLQLNYVNHFEAHLDNQNDVTFPSGASRPIPVAAVEKTRYGVGGGKTFPAKAFLGGFPHGCRRHGWTGRESKGRAQCGLGCPLELQI
jgi:hypothetical protein